METGVAAEVYYVYRLRVHLDSLRKNTQSQPITHHHHYHYTPYNIHPEPENDIRPVVHKLHYRFYLDHLCPVA